MWSCSFVVGFWFCKHAVKTCWPGLSLFQGVNSWKLYVQKLLYAKQKESGITTMWFPAREAEQSTSCGFWIAMDGGWNSMTDTRSMK